MTRQTSVLLYGGIATLIYICLALGILHLPLVSESASDELVPVLPWWALVTLGSYCLGELGYGVLTFGDCEEAYTELLEEVSQAKNELRAKGVAID
ncbi:uncharacterized protein L969DRAFT_75678 [Mixia osmundae IAM 14324]|uniref:Dolichol-phosphate mannosyltransferase subunit 3 n=1 Tax=Mixia osmundae (strain CBS 9802 / IAM 14324 / JCM 22182 / KY 12970) TaxID=764103 RepID=G7E8I7_MIXOS|nr:uncharacterized protein L969DRAFT_75678 [Mixia osmundae IAM 14324]KEI38887.1 hypothetical protein L969DRAFT_75678 [Mixia osmundae IAM 14324]GAA99147.1 hypothetical protein E5Q_05838 [Mixia osmundae IAM 14324]